MLDRTHGGAHRNLAGLGGASKHVHRVQELGWHVPPQQGSCVMHVGGPVASRGTCGMRMQAATPPCTTAHEHTRHRSVPAPSPESRKAARRGRSLQRAAVLSVLQHGASRFATGSGPASDCPSTVPDVHPACCNACNAPLPCWHPGTAARAAQRPWGRVRREPAGGGAGTKLCCVLIGIPQLTRCRSQPVPPSIHTHAQPPSPGHQSSTVPSQPSVSLRGQPPVS